MCWADTVSPHLPSCSGRRRAQKGPGKEGLRRSRFGRQVRRESNQSFHQRPGLKKQQPSEGESQRQTSCRPSQAQRSPPDHRRGHAPAQLLKRSHPKTPRERGKQTRSTKNLRPDPKGPTTRRQVLSRLALCLRWEFVSHSVMRPRSSCYKGSCSWKDLQRKWIVQGLCVSCGPDTS